MAEVPEEEIEDESTLSRSISDSGEIVEEGTASPKKDDKVVVILKLAYISETYSKNFGTDCKSLQKNWRNNFYTSIETTSWYEYYLF